MVDIVNGTGTKNIFDTVAETVDLSLTDSGGTGLSVTSTAQAVFAPGVITQFILNHPGSIAAGERAAYIVSRADQYGNLVNAATSTVYLYSNSTSSSKNFYDAAIGGSTTTSVVIPAGTSSAAFWYYDTLVGTPTITASDNSSAPDGAVGITDATDPLQINSSSTAAFFLTHPGTITAGTRAGYTISRKDAFGNAVTLSDQNVYLYASPVSGTGNFFAGATDTSPITSLVIPSGSVSANFWYEEATSGVYTITASDNSSAPDGAVGIADASASIQVVPGPINKFVLNNPGSMSAGTRLGYTVSREDSFGNEVTSGINLVYLYSSSHSSGHKFYDSASGGSVITFAVINNGAPSAEFWYYEENPGSWTVTASDNSSAPDGILGVGDASQGVTVSAAPIIATKLSISTVASSLVNAPATVTVRAEDDSGNLDTTFNGSVTLNVSGSATGGGVVTITNGVGTATVNDTVPETVTLSLTDSGVTGLDVSSEQYLTFTSLPPTGGGNFLVGALPLISGVRFSGRAYPGAKINILAFGTSTAVLTKSAVGSTSGSFTVSFQNAIPTGDRSFGVSVQDPDGRTTQALVYGVNLRNQADLLQISNITFPPTVGFSQATVTKGSQLTVVGYASPGATVSFEIDNHPIILTATAASNGFYQLLYPTGDLSLGSHTLRAKEIDVSGESSTYSVQKVFTVSPLLTPQVDFNHDGKVNVLDWSIFLSRWLSTDPKVRALDDLNGDGRVDIQDFSIFVRTMKPA